MAKKIEDLLMTPTQEDAYKAIKIQLQQRLNSIGKKTVNTIVDRKNVFSSLGMLQATPMAFMRQYVYKQGWNSVVNKYLSSDAPKAASNPVLKATAGITLGGVVTGALAGAALGFAIVGGAAALAPLIVGVLGAVGLGGSLGVMAYNDRKTLHEYKQKGIDEAKSSEPVNALAVEALAVKDAAKFQQKQLEAQEKEISALHKEAESKMKTRGKSGSFVADVNARKERADEMLEVTAA